MKTFGFIKKAICAMLVLFMLVGLLMSCGSKGKPLLMLDDSSISVNIFELYLTRRKGTLSSMEYGDSVKSDEFWDTWIDIYDKKTLNTHYTEEVLDSAKTYLAAIAAFDELGLELPKSYIDEIDATLDEMVENEANGSKSAFNSILSHYGVNYDILREAYIIDAKIAHLRDELFGKNGSKVGANLIDDYYKENYARFKQVFLYTYEFVYEEDENGDPIYYRKDNSSRISYDKTKIQKLNADGSPAYDKNGDYIYVYVDKDGKERIAYSKKDASAKQKYDSTGNPLIKYYGENDPEMKIVLSDADELFAQTAKGDFSGFDKLVTEYNQEDGSQDYPNGYYVSANTAYEAGEVIETVLDMEVGEVKKIRSEYGVHILMRYELVDKAYTFEENEDLFISTKTGTYVFMQSLIDELLYEYLKDYKARVTVDEELLKTVDIKRADINFYY